MPWLSMVHGSLCLEENHRRRLSQMNLRSFTFSRQVCISLFACFIRTAPNSEYSENIRFPNADPNAVKPGEETSTGLPVKEQQPQPTPPSSSTNAARGASPFQQVAGPEESRRAVSPQSRREARPSPNSLQSQPTSMNERVTRVPGGDDDGESSTESAIRGRVVVSDHARSLSSTASGMTPVGPVGIESMAKTVLQRRSESPIVDRERVKSPDAHEQRQPNVNGFNSAHDTKSGSAGNVTAELIRGLKARDAELETLRRREAWMKVALVQAAQAGFVYVNTSPGDEDLESTDEQPKIAEEMRGAAAPNEADAERKEDETKNGEAKSKIREAEVFAQEIEAQREAARRLEERARLSLEEAERLVKIGETAAQKKEVEVTRKEAKAKKLEAEALVREAKAQTREAEVLLRETAIEWKEEEVSRREDEARRLEERARQALESIRQAEASVKMREAVVQQTVQQMEAEAARREGDLKKREAEVQHREAEACRKDEEVSKQGKQAHFEKVRQWFEAEAYTEMRKVSTYRGKGRGAET